MITITGFEQRENEKGENFNVLVLEGEVEMVKSEAGNMYATCKKTTIPSTFSSDRCEKLIGTEMPGTIEKVPSEPYEYQLEDGQTILLEHTYQYNPAPVSTEEHVFEGQSNGVTSTI